MNRNFIYTLVAAISLVPISSFGHAHFKIGGTTTPRSTDMGLKTAPCGGIARTATPTILTAGQQLTLQIDEVIDHPGYYRVAFSMAGDAFPAAMPVPTAATPASADLWVPYIQDVPNVHAYTATVTVPNTPCTQCSLQAIQYMTESNPPTMYYSCADIVIQAAGATPPPPPPPPAPVPTPCK